MEVDSLDISVIICAYTEERWDALATAIESVCAQTLAAREIVVVIDHNTALLEQVQRSFPTVLAVPNSQQHGLSGARNSGIAVAQGSIVAFLDDDAAAATDWLEHVRAAYRDPQVMGAGGAIIPSWETARPAWFPEEFDWVVGCTYRGMPQTATSVRNLIGANMSFLRSMLLELGGFQHGIGRVGKRPLGCEETELCIRAHQCWPYRTLRYLPQAQVFHLVPTTRGTWAYFWARCYAEGLSKALVTRLVGSQDGLSSERSYALHTLPQSVVRNAATAVAQRNLAGVQRASAITTGLTITVTGYVIGHLSQLLALYRADVPATASSAGG